MHRFLLFTVAICGLHVTGFAAEDEAVGAARERKQLAAQILADPDLPLVLEKAKVLLKTGLNAGSGYGEVWIRDLNTFIELSLEVNDQRAIRRGLLTFFKFQGPEGDIVDGYIPAARGNVAYRYRRSQLAPNLLAHKNTVETDQESSLVQAVSKYVKTTGDRTLLDETVADVVVSERLERALRFVLRHRFDAKHELVWGATTADWGDVQPEHEWGVELDENSHRAIDIYDNAMFLVALDNYLELTQGTSTATDWLRTRESLRDNIRKHLWDDERQKFIPHVYLDGSPFPATFDEASVYYHGGTAVAIEAGVLSRDEIRSSLEQMVRNVQLAQASSIGLTLYPTYPEGFFKNKAMHPYGYQNGGDWCWFGGRMIQQLIRHGFVAEAYRELKPMVTRVKKHGDFHEWWSRDNQPKGSGKFRGSAGVLGQAIEQLLSWAKENS